MQYLPNEKEQQWLLWAMKSVVLARGYEQLAVRPIIEPTRRFFPERWRFSQSGLEALTRKLLGYAELDHLDLRIDTYSEREELYRLPERHSCGSTAGLFLGIEQGCAMFAFNVDAPSDMAYIAGVMGHEVAHAYRAFHALAVDDRSEEELLTDVTTIYLGFGILAANSSYRYRTAGDWGYQSWSTVTTGYLSPQGFAYLLGAQLLLRGLVWRQPRRLLRHLEPNQRAFTRAAIKKLRPLAHYLPKTLGTPPTAEWVPGV